MMSFFVSNQLGRCVFQKHHDVIIIQTVRRERTRPAVVRAPCFIYNP